MNEFTKLGLSKKVTDVLESINIRNPTEIQRKTIPFILEGKDIIGAAATGSGKTFAFSSVILEKVKPKEGIQALILVPTRELAEQVAKAIRNFSRNFGIKIKEIYGGVNFERQINEARNSEVIVGTPGRLLDHLNKKTFDFFDLKFLVLDEADRMCDMGFLPDVERIVSSCPKKRQTLLFSATISHEVDYIAKKYMINPTDISVEKYVEASKLRQFYYDIPNQLKFSLLVHLLKGEKSEIVLVFCNTRRNVDLVAVNLRRYGINSVPIHGGLDQKKRNKIMELVHKNQTKVLICTDVAARGLDIRNVSHVYNYDIPRTSKEYVHRIGRTARAGKDGLAINIVTGKDYENFRNVLSDTSIKIENKETPEVKELKPRFNSPREQGNRNRNFHKSHRGNRNTGHRRRGSFRRR